MNITKERFLMDVAQHEMIVKRDGGVSRHLRFQKPGTMCMHFDIITWPGYLCYTGDMGTYVFRRIPDMFEFFRTDTLLSATLKINPGYWGEKLEAVDRHDGYREWNKDKFKSRLREDFAEFISERDPGDREKLKERLEDEVISGLDYGGKESAYRAVLGFKCNGQFPFQDWWEVDTDEYAYRFIWCCYALVWGIQKYDESKASVEEAVNQ